MHRFFCYADIRVVLGAHFDSIHDIYDERASHSSRRTREAETIIDSSRQVPSELLYNVLLRILKDTTKELVGCCTFLWMKLLRRANIESFVEHFSVCTPETF